MTALTTPTRFAESNGRRLAYRSIGEGQPIVLCTRFRGNLDVWDPAFLDALAAGGLRVITFDYSGLGLSTGTRTYDAASLAKDAHDLIEALELKNVIIGGWSLGGIAAQLVIALYPQRLSHAVLIGTTPPGPMVKPPEQLFYDTARLAEYGIEAEEILFFEPKSALSRAAARRSVDRIAQRQDRSVPVPVDFAANHLGTGPKGDVFPAVAVLELLKRTTLPILHIGGDHDIIFPVENWYALNQLLPTVRLLTFPSAGHGPHHQHPQAAADAIVSFVREPHLA
ncbi:alpha/beta fold hydrolase [Piscinibacter gummiphilus]|nr:alpha/beta hydrolase [Piscinibacter gummiphilus]GLS92976.1 alpha/beta hydrolase [Piscinibacter gummiphilus]